MSPTRRELMHWATAAVAASQAISRPLKAAGPSPGEVSVRTTSGSQRFAPGVASPWRPARDSSADAVTLDPARRYQEVLGFGAAFTDASCYLLSRLPASSREQVLRDLVHPSGLGLNVFRICMGSSDYATKAYTYDEGDPDPEMARFSIDHDREYILPVLKQARTLNPDLYLLASPWTPPGWMKANRSMLGGSMRKSNFAPYATYFVKFLKAYADAGVPVQAVSVQNEVDTDQDSKMPACLWGQEYEIEFIARHLGPQLAASQIDTKIWILDHNYNLWGRALAELDDPTVNRLVDGVAWHGYVGQPSAMSRVHDMYPDKHMYWTEGGPDYHSQNYQTDWSHWGRTFADILRNWGRCVIGWNIALDEAGKPNIGPFDCGGAITIHSQTNEITRSGQYWAFAHYSKAIQRGSRRIDSASVSRGLSHVAVVRGDGSSALILTNAEAGRRVAVRVDGMESEVELPADSISTLTWRA